MSTLETLLVVGAVGAAAYVFLRKRGGCGCGCGGGCAGAGGYGDDELEELAPGRAGGARRPTFFTRDVVGAGPAPSSSGGATPRVVVRGGGGARSSCGCP